MQFQDGDNSSKGDKESPALGKSGLLPAFREVISLITGFFPAAKPADSTASVDLSPWFDDFGTACCRDPRVFLSLFDKLAPVKQDIDDKFQKAADEKKKANNAVEDLCKLHKVPKINESFSRLLDKPVSTSHHVSLSSDELAKLWTCIREMIKSQSFSLWALASVFAFLKDSGCTPEDNIFHQLILSSTIPRNSQVKASFSAASFLKQKRWETLVSHLPSATHASVKHALLTSPSSSSLFAEDMIRNSLTQVKGDSQLKLLKYLSSIRGGKQMASSASTSGQQHGSSYSLSSSSSSSYLRSASWSSRGSKRPSSSSLPSRRS